ncbi:hypothetical protein RKD23_007571 [Streptomyces sp. SAI-170]|uniref:hypothetical protein n=1 Tax=Streptomyces sp. SAI-170 TaxID=3377729 RepID=UPI003C7D96AF
MPTLEFRAADACPMVGDTALRAACRRTVRDGLAVDLADGRLRPAAQEVERLLHRLHPALRRHGDADLVREGAWHAGVSKAAAPPTGAVDGSPTSSAP